MPITAEEHAALVAALPPVWVGMPASEIPPLPGFSPIPYEWLRARQDAIWAAPRLVAAPVSIAAE